MVLVLLKRSHVLAQPAELIASGGEVATCAEEEGEEGGDGASPVEEGAREAGHESLGCEKGC